MLWALCVSALINIGTPTTTTKVATETAVRKHVNICVRALLPLLHLQLPHPAKHLLLLPISCRCTQPEATGVSDNGEGQHSEATNVP